MTFRKYNLVLTINFVFDKDNFLQIDPWQKNAFNAYSFNKRLKRVYFCTESNLKSDQHMNIKNSIPILGIRLFN